MSVKKAGKTGRTKPLIVVAPAVAASPSSDTPETDALAGEWIACECVPASHSRKLERERDEARLLCRWAFPRLRAMCHDFDATGTGWCCAEEMESHPEIFSSENDKVSDGGPLTHESKQDANPPFAAPLG